MQHNHQLLVRIQVGPETIQATFQQFRSHGDQQARQRLRLLDKVDVEPDIRRNLVETVGEAVPAEQFSESQMTHPVTSERVVKQRIDPWSKRLGAALQWQAAPLLISAAA